MNPIKLTMTITQARLLSWVVLRRRYLLHPREGPPVRAGPVRTGPPSATGPPQGTGPPTLFMDFFSNKFNAKLNEANIMKTIYLKTGLAALALAAMGFSSSAFAAGTASGTSIDNRAEVSYTVGTTLQDIIESSSAGNSTPGAGNGADTSFLVDNRVDVSVTETANNGVGDDTYTSVVPNSTGYVTAFTVQNDGNTSQGYTLSAADVAAAQVLYTLADDYDIVTGTGALNVFVEDGTTAGYQSAEDTATAITSLAADASVVVYVVATVDAGAADDNFAVVSLTATTTNDGTATTTTETAGADTTAVDVVFADGAGTDDAANDGAASDRDAYLVQTADVSISKTSAVVADPINGTTNPKAIPGAIIEYTITVDNDATASASATGITITDVLDTEVLAGTILYCDEAPTADVDFDCADGGTGSVTLNLNGGGVVEQTDASDADDTAVTDAATVDTVVDTITVDVGTLAAGQNAVITYRVVIQ